MSSYLRKVLQTPPPEARTEVVEFTDPETCQVERVELRAYNDAESIVTNLTMDEAHQTAMATSYTATLKLRGLTDCVVSPAMVQFIRLVHQCLVTPEGETPLDESDVAYLAKRHGNVFLKLLNAAGQLMNLENAAEQFLDARVGKLPADSEPSPSASGSGRSARRAKSQQP